MKSYQQNRKINILYADDEKYNLQAFVAYFRKHPHFRIYIAESGHEGLEILKRHPIQVILSDQKMPNMTGIEFFEKACILYPHPARIIVTAHIQCALLEQAKRDGKIYGFQGKPWDWEHLEALIIEAHLFCKPQEYTGLPRKGETVRVVNH